MCSDSGLAIQKKLPFFCDLPRRSRDLMVLHTTICFNLLFVTEACAANCRWAAGAAAHRGLDPVRAGREARVCQRAREELGVPRRHALFQARDVSGNC